MKRLKLSAMALLALAMTNSIANAQEPPCAECNLPPQAVGNGGVTCEIAKKAFENGVSAKDSIGFYEDTQVTFALASEVYCTPGYGYYAQGGATSLTFDSKYQSNGLDYEEQLVTSAFIDGVMGLPGLSTRQAVSFTKKGDACFSRPRYFYNAWDGWHIPQRGSRQFYSYQCRVPVKNTEGLICKVSLNGQLDIGYQIFVMNSSFGAELPEGLLR